MSGLTKQEIFNIVWKHFITDESPRSVSENGMCMYRSKDGNRCAIGLLIPDESYMPKMESLTPGGAIVWAVLKPLVADDANMLKFLDDLQRVHDGCREDYLVPSDFVVFANRWNLAMGAE